MLYTLFEWLHKLGMPGSGIFQYISFRSAMAFVVALIISIFFGKPFIRLLRRKQIGESVRDLGLAGQAEKAGTPTMGGLIIIAAMYLGRIGPISMALFFTAGRYSRNKLSTAEGKFTVG